MSGSCSTRRARPCRQPLPAGRAGWIAAAALVVVAAVAAVGALASVPVAVPPPLVRLDVELGSEVSIQPLSEPTFSSLIISPDGTRVVFVGRADGGSRRLFVKRLDDAGRQGNSRHAGREEPFFSPDGQWVGFFNGGRLSKVPLDGGVVVTLSDINVMTGAAWAADGSIVAGSGVPGTAGLVRIPAAGGPPIPIVTLASDELFVTFSAAVAWREGGAHAVVRRPASPATTNIEIVHLEDGRRKPLLRAATSPRYLPSGHRGVRHRGRDVRRAVRQRPARDRGNGGSDQSGRGVRSHHGRSRSSMSRVTERSSTGRRPETAARRQRSCSGPISQESCRRFSDKAGLYGTPRLSPDGSRVAIVIREGTSDAIWVLRHRARLDDAPDVRRWGVSKSGVDW